MSRVTRPQRAATAPITIITTAGTALFGIEHTGGFVAGDSVAVVGPGAIGLMAVQCAKALGAGKVILTGTRDERLNLGKKLGADVVVSSAGTDAGLAIKRQSEGRGVDVAIDISGVYAALQQALRCVHREGLVVTVSFYGDQTGRIDLSSEWHHNRITLRSSMPVWGCAHRWQPMWDLARVECVAIGLLEDRKLQVEPLIGARVPFEQAADAYAMIDESPGDKVKILLTYD